MTSSINLFSQVALPAEGNTLDGTQVQEKITPQVGEQMRKCCKIRNHIARLTIQGAVFNENVLKIIEDASLGLHIERIKEIEPPIRLTLGVSLLDVVKILSLIKQVFNASQNPHPERIEED